MRRLYLFTKIRFLIMLLSLFLSSCAGTPSASNNPSPTPEPSATPTTQSSPLVGFEKDLQYIRNGGFTYIWVFSRKDKKPLDKDDGNFLRTNAPQVVDWVTTDEGRKVIGGTNFNLEEGNLEQLKKRFVTENYSGR